MNCQEYKGMIEDALDISLNGEIEANIRRHLDHCPECREYLAMRRQEHAAFFAGVNAAYSHLRSPPEDLADRVVREVAVQRSARRGWRRFSLPRWALIAASVAVMAGFVFAATVVVDGLRGEEAANQEGEAANQGDVVANQGAETAGCAPLGAPQTGIQLETNQKGEVPMIKAKAAAAALTATLAAGAIPLAESANSGAVMATSASFEAVDPPYGAASSVATSCIELDARAIVCRETNVISLYTCPRTGVTIIVF